MSELQDPNAPFTEQTVQRLDSLIQAMNGSDPGARSYAMKVLNDVRENGSMWVHADKIIEQSPNPDTKFFALALLEGAIRTGWNGVAEDQRTNIKNYIVKLVIDNASSGSSHLLNKLNQVLVQIVKREWTTSWKSFISEICGASKSSQPLCENTMNVLKMLSQEIFESKDTLNSNKREELKATMNSEFSNIHDLCIWVLRTAAMHPDAVQKSLVKACLSTLAAFLSWIPAAHIFAGELVSIIQLYLDAPLFAAQALECLAEVATITMNLSPEDPSYGVYENAVISMFSETIKKLNSVFPADISQVYSPNTKPNLQQLALFLLNVSENHLELFDSYCLKNTGNELEHALAVCMDSAVKYVNSLMTLPEDEIFKICVDFWHNVSKYLYEKNSQGWPASLIWNQVYKLALPDARAHVIGKMAKPTEVMASVDEQGNTVIEKMVETEIIALYEAMRETLIYLTHLDPEDTQNTIMLKMAKQMDGSEWSWQRVSSLAYAIGSISGTLDESTEKKFLIHTIKDLLALCEGKRGKENKAVVATNIMYVVMQYPRFMTKHWNFMKTVINKLFEFMHERHPGIKDMSVDTLLRISQTCGLELLILHESADQHEPFIYEIERNLADITNDLENHQKFVFYQALGCTLANFSDESQFTHHVNACLALLSEEWARGFSFITSSQNLTDLDAARSLAFVVKANESFAGSIGHYYYVYMNAWYNDLLETYRIYSQFLQASIAQAGQAIVSHSFIIAGRTIRRRILGLFSTFFKNLHSMESCVDLYLTSLLELILTDFINSNDLLKETEVISLVADLIKKAGTLMMPFMGVILGSFLDSVLALMSTDFTTFPEHRSCFFELLKSVSGNCLEALVQLPIERFKLAVDTVLWACKHQTTAHSEAGLITMEQMLGGLEHNIQVANYFYQNFYMYIITEMFAIFTDSSHLPNFKYIGSILYYLCYVIASGVLTVQLGDTENTVFVVNQLGQLLSNNFTNMNKTQIETFIISMYNRSMGDPREFKQVLRDFLVAAKEIAADNEALYVEEREKEMQEAKQRMEAKKSMVPGLLRPIN